MTCPVVWYYVPRDRPFLPLQDGWLWWDSERDPENEGIRRATGELSLGEDYFADPRWVRGADPLKTRWVEGVYQGTEEQWRGEGIPPPRLIGPIVRYLPYDCCGHGDLPVKGDRCVNAFLFGGPAVFHVTVGEVVSTDPQWMGIPPRTYDVPWFGPGNPCLWFRPISLPIPPVQVGVGVGGSPSSQFLALLFLAFGGPGGSQFRGITYQPKTAIPAFWSGDTPIVMKKTGQDFVSATYHWPDEVTLVGGS